VFRGVDLALPAGSVTAVAGPAGSGRSMLLLTLAGRARPSAGTLTIAGESHRTRLRQAVTVARISESVELEPELRVAEHIREAALLASGPFDAHWARDLVGSTADTGILAAELPTDESVLLSVALAVAGRPVAVVVDDVDLGASVVQQQRIWRALRSVADAGIAVIATTVDGDIAVSAGATVVRLEAADARV
jgi:ABC-2 type transport system ATP-binding protein